MLIALEGIDGSGKSTLARRLTELLTAQGKSVVLTKEPGGGPGLGTHVRKILQHREYPLDPKAEFLLFAADRAQHMEHLILPSLRAGKIVISDRMADSALVYQGYGRGLDKQIITEVNTWAMQGVTPDCTIYVRIDLVTAKQRIAQRTDKPSAFDLEQESFFAKLIAGYDELYRDRTDVITIDGKLRPEELAQQTFTQLPRFIMAGKQPSIAGKSIRVV